jgi:hypothetical protein
MLLHEPKAPPPLDREESRFAPVAGMERENLRYRLKRRLELTDEEIDSLISDSGGYQVARKLLRKRRLPEEPLREKRYEHVLYEAGVLTLDDLERIRASRRIL